MAIKVHKMVLHAGDISQNVPWSSVWSDLAAYSIASAGFERYERCYRHRVLL